MNPWVRRLYGLALLCVFVALAALSWAGGDLATVKQRVLEELARDLSGPWRWVAVAAAGSAGLALVVTLLSVFWPQAQRPSPRFDALGQRSTRESVLEVERRVRACLQGAEPNVIAAVDELIRGAVQVSASDVHMSPTPAGFKLTYRVQGTLHDVVVLEPQLAPLLVTRIKVLARLDTYVHGTPQDGRLVMHLDSGTVEARTSTLPTETGERVVLRLVRGSLSVPDLEALGFSPGVLDRIREMLSRPQGMIFVTGPVGSGKTTTLYAGLQYISRTRGGTTQLVTLEDPIELQLPFAVQTQMNPRAGMTFAGTLRSVLRQDPNVLMVGEIRDRETAEIAMQAGLTGHLILTTVHAESAAGPFARLIDMNVEPFVVASATIGVISQRLVRILCTACRRAAPPEPMHVERFARLGVELPKATYYEPVGCTFCENQGFTGRMPLAELLVMDSELRHAVNQRETTDTLHALAAKAGMASLVKDGLTHAVAGDTSLTEVLRVAG